MREAEPVEVVLEPVDVVEADPVDEEEAVDNEAVEPEVLALEAVEVADAVDEVLKAGPPEMMNCTL